MFKFQTSFVILYHCEQSALVGESLFHFLCTVINLISIMWRTTFVFWLLERRRCHELIQKNRCILVSLTFAVKTSYIAEIYMREFTYDSCILTITLESLFCSQVHLHHPCHHLSICWTLHLQTLCLGLTIRWCLASCYSQRNHLFRERYKYILKSWSKENWSSLYTGKNML